MIDWSHISELQSEFGPADFEEVITLFLEEAEETLQSLSAAPATETPAALHFLRGSARTVGFVDLANRCEAAEKTGNCDAAVLRKCLTHSILMLRDRFPRQTNL